MILDIKQQEFLQIAFAKCVFEQSGLNSIAGWDSHSTINRQKIKAAVQEIIKRYPATDEDYWLDLIMKIKAEQFNER